MTRKMSGDRNEMKKVDREEIGLSNTRPLLY
jgi:hypothetical protein